MKKMRRTFDIESTPTDFGAAREPEANRPGLAVKAVVNLLNLYHALLAPSLAALAGSSCRFEPSCSRYAQIAVVRHGLRRGVYFALRRLARCHPWGAYGYDPVPQDSSHQT